MEALRDLIEMMEERMMDSAMSKSKLNHNFTFG